MLSLPKTKKLKKCNVNITCEHLMKLFKRENYLKKIRGFYTATNIIEVMGGVRRCGESSLMLTIVDELIEQHIPK